METEYSVSYNFKSAGGFGFGNTSISGVGNMDSMDDISRVEKAIMEGKGFENCVILSFQRLK